MPRHCCLKYFTWEGTNNKVSFILITLHISTNLGYCPITRGEWSFDDYTYF